MSFQAATPNWNQVGSEMYSGLATVGRIHLVIIAILLGILGVVTLVAGSVGLADASKHPSQTADGKVTNIECVQNQCAISVVYTVNGKEYTLITQVGSDQKYTVGQTVKVQFHVATPDKASLVIVNFKATSIGLMVLGGICFLLIMVLIFIAKKKSLSALAGGGALFRL